MKKQEFIALICEFILVYFTVLYIFQIASKYLFRSQNLKFTRNDPTQSLKRWFSVYTRQNEIKLI